MSIQLGLDRMKALLEHINYSRPTIHIVGTNGKGSVSTLIERVLLSSGLSVGKFTSPHLVHVYDCISVNGEALSSLTYQRWSTRVESLSMEHQIQASPFELLTATALSIFEEMKLDAVIMEAGMGGRLDATNAVPDETMLITTITAIDLDHQAFLGDTISAIAREKAGAIRDGGLVVLGDQSPDNESDVLDAVSEIAFQKKATLVRSKPVLRIIEAPDSSHTDGDSSESVAPFQTISFPSLLGNSQGGVLTRLSLLGEHQLSNAGVAYQVLRTLRESRPTRFDVVNDGSILSGFAAARWLGRLSWTTETLPNFLSDEDGPSLKILVDGAHNAASSRTLASYLRSVGQGGCPRDPRTFIIALSHSPPKTPSDVLKELLKPGDRVALVPFREPVEGMPWVRNVQREELKSCITGLIGSSSEIWEPQVHADYSPLLQALHWARYLGDIAIVAGSLYLMGDFYREFGATQHLST